MERLNEYKIRLLFVGIVAAIVIGVGSVKADFTFGTPTNLGPNVNSTGCEYGLSVSSDGLSLFFDSDRPDLGDFDLYVSTRETTDDEWGPAINLGPAVNSPKTHDEACPSISADGLELFFSAVAWGSNPAGFGKSDLWVTRRATPDDPWSEPENLGPTVNTINVECEPSISADGLSLYFSSDRGGWGIWVTTRKTKADPWQEPVNLGPLVSSGTDGAPSISSDGRVLFFMSGRPGGYGGSDIWMTRRATEDVPWEEPVNLGPGINTPGDDFVPCISADGRTLYFSSHGLKPNYGWYDIWQAPIIPIVDFNGDGKVDACEVCKMADCWGTDDSLCDIGPMPWGDGVVDVRDLEVLIKYIEPIDYTLIAHWTLDETEGMFAHNSINGDDDYVLGSAIWQPAGGMIDGALELDGIDDSVISSFIFNPAEGPFSVFAWIKCSTPGKTIISQPSGSDWLAMDADGNLMTELAGSGNSAAPLISQTLIADDQWHRIGFVWDGSQRMLYVDSVSVAEDTQDGLVGLNNGIYIGVGKNYTAGTFFSGLVDDVQIYKGVVSP
jgi:hypothetical protein